MTTKRDKEQQQQPTTSDESAQQILALDALLRRAPSSLAQLAKQSSESQGARELVQLGVAFLSSFLAAVDARSADSVVQNLKRKRADSPTKQRPNKAEQSSKQLTTFLGPSPIVHVSLVDDHLEVLRQRQDGSHAITVSTIPLSLEIAACDVESGKKEVEKAESALRSWWDAHPVPQVTEHSSSKKSEDEYGVVEEPRGSLDRSGVLWK